MTVKILVLLLQAATGQVASGFLSDNTFNSVAACEAARPGIVAGINEKLKDKGAEVVYSSCTQVPAEQQ